MLLHPTEDGGGLAIYEPWNFELSPPPPLPWVMLPINTAKIIALGSFHYPALELDFLRSTRYSVYGLPVQSLRSVLHALEAIVAHEKAKEKKRTAADSVERTRHLNLLRLEGIRQFGRVGNATTVSLQDRHSGPYKQFATVIVPDDTRSAIQGAFNSRPLFEALVTGGRPNLIRTLDRIERPSTTLRVRWW